MSQLKRQKDKKTFIWNTLIEIQTKIRKQIVYKKIILGNNRL